MRIKRIMAQITVILILNVWMLPAHGAEIEKTYTVESVVLAPTVQGDTIGRFTGPDVQSDGTILIERGKSYNFTWEEIDHATGWGLNLDFRMTPEFEDEGWLGLSLNADTLFGMGAGNAANREQYIKLPEKIEFRNVSLYDKEQHIYTSSAAPELYLQGDFIIDVERRIYAETEYELPTSRENMVSYLNRDSEDEYQLIEPFEAQEIAVYHIEYRGIAFSASTILNANLQLNYYSEAEEAYYAQKELAEEIYTPHSLHCSDYNAMVTYKGETYYFDKQAETGTYGFLRPFVEVMFDIIDWNMVEYTEESYVNTNQSVVTEETVEETEAIWVEYSEDMNVPTGKIVITAIAAGTLAMGGSVFSNLFCSFIEEKREKEEKMLQLIRSTKDDTKVSMSIYKPFKALVNTKGAAADLHITINGGEGIRWNYIPTAVCLDGLKAVIPTVAGHGAEATLVLALTGAQLKKPHTAIFVTVIAWAYAEDGKLIKTTGSTEIALHSKGLEAKWNEDGTLKVCSYSDSNLDGIAEIRELTENEYIVSEDEDGEIIISAKETQYGSVRIKKEGI